MELKQYKHFISNTNTLNLSYLKTEPAFTIYWFGLAVMFKRK
ncbi:hypothetical protein A21D_03463 [Virgibacillus dokdonensis]|uniref:Uncharacterized protein n=1 Tax=Virgibacillus dokdonensis TaxID=302167 RepID=A0A2K9J3H2_9BACI|nr:hypothetical protein A21D_03463 [Virgibacillus dokdonensis]